MGIHTEEIRIERDMCTPVFAAALFTEDRTWKKPRCHSTDEWIKKLWYINTIEYYSAIQRNALEKEMATHSSVLAWRIPGTGEPGGLPSMRLRRVGHN